MKVRIAVCKDMCLVPNYPLEYTNCIREITLNDNTPTNSLW